MNYTQRVQSNKKKRSRNSKTIQKTLPLAGEKKKFLCIGYGIKKLFEAYLGGSGSKSRRKKSSGRKSIRDSKFMEDKLTLRNIRKKSSNSNYSGDIKSFYLFPKSAKANKEEIKQSTKLQQNRVLQLEKEFNELIDRKTNKNEKLKSVLKSIDGMYEKYSDLSKRIIKEKQLEEPSFEKYINACQNKEKVMIDMNLETSNQRMKIKLLHETLAKRNQEHNNLLEKTKNLVFFLYK